MSMDQTVDTASVLLLNLPNSAFCGIDLLSFTASPRFRGIKHIPKGWHFIFTGATTSFSLRSGAWFHVSGVKDLPSELFVKNWSPESEELLAEVSEQTILHWRANLGSIWRDGLTPYRQTVTDSVKTEDGLIEEKQDWIALTDHINETLLTRITGSPVRDHWALSSASSAKQDVDEIPGLSKEESSFNLEKELSFLPVNLKQTWPEGAVGRARTEAAQDRSWALSDLMEKHCDRPQEVLGELQFTFVMTLTLNNNSCFEQWKRLLSLLLTCRKAVVTQSSYFVQVLTILRLQLEHSQDADGGLFDMSDESGNLIKSLLKKFRSGLEHQSGPGKSDVLDELDDLEEYLKRTHGWLVNDPYVKSGMIDLEDGERVEMDMNEFEQEDESGEYAPAIVNLTPEQAQELAQQPGFSRVVDHRFVNTALNTNTSDVEYEVVDGQVRKQPVRTDSDTSSEDETELDAMDTRF